MSDEKKIDMNEEHPDYPGLTRAEVEAEKEAARKAVAKEIHKKRLAAIREQEEIALRSQLGETERTQRETDSLTPVNREMVSITLNLAPQMADIRMDGVIYRNRGTYTVTRAKACEMMRIQYEGWRHEAVRKGDDAYAFYAQMHQQAAAIPTRSGLTSSLVLSNTGSLLAGRMPKGTH